MAAVVKRLDLEQGATFTMGFTWYQPGPVVGGVVTPGDPYDLTGCTAAMQIRHTTADTVVILTATSLTTGAGANRITLGGATGRVDLVLTDADTNAMLVTSGVYDLEITWPMVDGELRPRVDRILQGVVTCSLNVTRDS